MFRLQHESGADTCEAKVRADGGVSIKPLEATGTYHASLVVGRQVIRLGQQVSCVDPNTVAASTTQPSTIVLPEQSAADSPTGAAATRARTMVDFSVKLDAASSTAVANGAGYLCVRVHSNTTSAHRTDLIATGMLSRASDDSTYPPLDYVA